MRRADVLLERSDAENGMVDRERIVAVSLLTASELAVVGQTLQRVYHFGEDRQFDDLLDAIDRADRALAAQTPEARRD